MNLTLSKLDQIVAAFDSKTSQHSASQERQTREKERLATFRIWTWFGKPKALSSLQCARKGWINTGKNTIQCSECQSQLAIPLRDPTLEKDDEQVAQYVQLLTSQHRDSCIWKSFTPLALRAVPLTRNLILERYNAWMAHPELLADWSARTILIDGVSLHDLGPRWTSFCNIMGNPSNHHALSLSLLAWRPSQAGMAYCGECDRTIVSKEPARPIDALQEHRI
ncbi:Nuclear-interacting partner of ALK, partial [Kappamyces sp. JEL0680]